MAADVRATSSHSDRRDKILRREPDGTCRTSAVELAQALRDGVITADEADSAWDSDGWQLPPGVISASLGPTCLTLHVRGRRVPVVGRRTNGVFVPQNRGANRRADLALLDEVASFGGERAEIPRAGHPGGLGRRAAEWMHRRPENVSMIEAAERAGWVLGWDVDSVVRCYRRWLRDQRRDLRAAEVGPDD